MNHLILLLICFLSIEIFNRSNYIFFIKSLVEVTKKAINIISNKNISDHWKENIIPKYSLQMMKYALKMLLILFSIIFIFVFADNLYNGFLAFTFSWNGIIESILIAFSFVYIRKLIFRWIIIHGWNKNCINLLFHRNLCEK